MKEVEVKDLQGSKKKTDFAKKSGKVLWRLAKKYRFCYANTNTRAHKKKSAARGQRREPKQAPHTFL